MWGSEEREARLVKEVVKSVRGNRIQSFDVPVTNDEDWPFILVLLKSFLDVVADHLPLLLLISTIDVVGSAIDRSEKKLISWVEVQKSGPPELNPDYLHIFLLKVLSPSLPDAVVDVDGHSTTRFLPA